MAYTKGPWVLGEVRLPNTVWGQSTTTIRTADGQQIAELRAGGPIFDANGYLMAAAPDLLEALYMVRDADNDCHKDGLPTIPPAARRFIDTAIAKAEGREP